MHADRGQADKYEEHFGCNVSFEAECNELVIPLEYLHKLLPRADADVFEVMRERCDYLERQITRAAGYPPVSG